MENFTLLTTFIKKTFPFSCADGLWPPDGITFSSGEEKYIEHFKTCCIIIVYVGYERVKERDIELKQ